MAEDVVAVTPLILTIFSSSYVTSRPQVASQSGQVLKSIEVVMSR